VRARLIVLVLPVMALSACTGSSLHAGRPQPVSSPMRIVARIRHVSPQEVEFARGSIWVLAGVNGAGPETPVARIDPVSNKVIADIDPSNGHISGPPWQMADDPSGLWIVLPTRSDPGDGDPGPVQKDVQTVYRGGHRVRADLNQESVAGGLALIDPAANKVLRSIMFLDWTPTSLASSSAGLWIAASDGSGALLALMDTKTDVFRVMRHTNEGTLRTGFGSLWSSSDDVVHRLDPATGRVLASFDTGNARDLAIGPDSVWVTTSSEVIRIDPATSHIVARISVPDARGVAADGGTVVATQFRTHRLVRIDPVRNAVVDSLVLPEPDPVNPITTEVVLAQGSAWVVNGTELVRVALG
jgi:DNA-binding beta-propeller fold protein YncE